MLERVAVRRAMKIAKSDAFVKAPEDVSFSIEAPENVLRGEEVKVDLKMKSKSAQPVSVNVSLTSQIVRYTGVALKKLEVRNAKEELQPKTGEGMYSFKRLM